MTAPEAARSRRRELSWSSLALLATYLVGLTVAGCALVSLTLQNGNSDEVAQADSALSSTADATSPPPLAERSSGPGETANEPGSMTAASQEIPVTEVRVTTEPVAQDPAAVDRPPVDPAAVNPAPGDPAPGDPAAIDPAAIEPAAIEPAAIEPAATATVAKVESPPAVEPAAPWSDVLRQEGPPPDFHSVCFHSFDPSAGMMQPDQLLQWLAPIDGQSHRIEPVQNRWGMASTLRGTVQLNAPWRDDTALRLVLESYDRLQLHFWTGRTGVTLIFYQRYKDAWAAFATRRKAGEVRPDGYELLASDGDRNFRTEARQGGEYLLRYQGGSLILTRGDVELLRVPLSESPRQVVWEGNGAVLDMALLRVGPVPDPQALAEPTLDTTRPDQLTWQRQLPAAAWLESRPDGSIQLSAHQAPQRGWVTTPLPPGGPREVILQVEDATPGTGVFLGRADGQPREVLRYARNAATGNTVLVLVMNDDQVQVNLQPPIERITPIVGRRHWLRLVFGCGQLRWWISGNGRDWAEPEWPTTQLPAGITTIGLHHVARADDCRIRLASVTLRPLAAVNDLADPQLVARAPALLEPVDLDGWRTEVDRQRPPELEVEPWRRACAVRALGAGAGEPLGRAVLGWLWDEMRQQPVARQLEMLADVALLSNLKDDRNRLLEFLSKYHGLGRDSAAQEPARPFSAVRQAMMTASLATPHAYGVVDPTGVRFELIELLYAGQWLEAANVCRQLRFFHLENSLPLFPWAESLTRGYLPETGPTRPTKRRSDWQHPLWEELDKDTYNTLAELRAACESSSWEDAARMIADLQPEEIQGLAPDATDDQLLVSLAAALQGFHQRPELASVMRDKLAQLAALRVAKAVADADPIRLALAAQQFAGTEAAAEAHRWLGDQAMSQGWFSRAEAEYERGLATAGIGLRLPLLAGQRLAAAMQNRDAGEPITASVELAGVSLSAEQFESLVQEMRTRPATSPSPQAVLTQTEAIPAAEPLRLFRHGPLDGPVGEQPASEVTRQTNQLRIGWVERQLAPVLAGDKLLVSNRFCVTAFDARSGQRQWQASLPDKQLRSQDWTCVPMFPLSSGGRVFARLLAAGGPTLVCLDEPTGQMLWSGLNQPQEFLVSDPLAARGEHYILTMVRGEQPEASLQLVRFHPDTGEPIARRQLLTLRDVWWTRRYCATTLYQDRLLVTLGGILLSCDLDGNVHWVRKQIVLPPNEEPGWISQYFQRPQVDQGHCFVVQPGVRTVECVLAETGRLVWRHTLPDIRRMVGFSGSLVIVETERQLLALRREDGSVVWSHDLADPLEARLCDDRFVVLAVRRSQPNTPNQYRPQLDWLRSEDGQVVASVDLEELSGADPRLGPLVVFEDRLFGFHGAERNQPQRELLELGPAK